MYGNNNNYRRPNDQNSNRPNGNGFVNLYALNRNVDSLSRNVSTFNSLLQAQLFTNVLQPKPGSSSFSSPLALATLLPALSSSDGGFSSPLLMASLLSSHFGSASSSSSPPVLPSHDSANAASAPSTGSYSDLAKDIKDVLISSTAAQSAALQSFASNVVCELRKGFEAVLEAGTPAKRPRLATVDDVDRDISCRATPLTLEYPHSCNRSISVLEPSTAKRLFVDSADVPVVVPRDRVANGVDHVQVHCAHAAGGGGANNVGAVLNAHAAAPAVQGAAAPWQNLVPLQPVDPQVHNFAPAFPHVDPHVPNFAPAPPNYPNPPPPHVNPPPPPPNPPPHVNPPPPPPPPPHDPPPPPPPPPAAAVHVLGAEWNNLQMLPPRLRDALQDAVTVDLDYEAASILGSLAAKDVKSIFKLCFPDEPPPVVRVALYRATKFIWDHRDSIQAKFM